MKRTNLSKVVGSGILALSLVTIPLSLPASAQNNNESNGPTVDTTPFQETENDFNNFGWLGLIGLVGLVKLFRKDQEPEDQHDLDQVNSTGYDRSDAVHPSSYADPNAVNTTYTDPDVVNRNLDQVNPTGYNSPDAVHPSSYADPNAVGSNYTDPDVAKRSGGNSNLNPNSRDYPSSYNEQDLGNRPDRQK